MLSIPPRLPLLFLGCALLLCPLANAARLYKWVDEAGNVQYTEKPPRDINTEKAIEGNEPETTPAAPVDNSPLVIPEATDQEASERTTRQCQGLLDELQRYSNGDDLTDANGKPVVVSPEMRMIKAEQIQRELDKHCR